MTYYGIQGKEYTVKEPCLASGGEGKIYEVPADDNLVVKVYKEKRRTAIREQKLQRMLQQHLSEEQLQQVCWPLDIVYENNNFAGYVMRKLTGTKNLSLLFSDESYSLSLKERITLAYNLSAAVDTVHSIGQVCGDLNPQNICVFLRQEGSRNHLHVALVDTDSWHISDNAGQMIWRCEVGLPEYLAPEIQKKMALGYNLKNVSLPSYTVQTDLFALAVHIFRLFMNGCHPFNCAKTTLSNQYDRLQGVNQPSTIAPQAMDNIVDGYFPFYHQRSHYSWPLFAPSLTVFPEYFQKMFLRAFVEGYVNPMLRPTAEEWMKAVEKLMGEGVLVSCENNHWHAAETGESCPWCEMKERMQNRTTFQPQEMVFSSGTDVDEEENFEEKYFNTVSGSGSRSSGQNTVDFTISYSGTGDQSDITGKESLQQPAHAGFKKFLKWCVIFVIVICIVGVAESNHNEKVYDSYLKSAEEMLLNEDYEGAAECYGEAIDLIEMRPAAYTGLSNWYVLVGDYAGAKAIIEEGYESASKERYAEEWADLEEQYELVTELVEGQENSDTGEE